MSQKVVQDGLMAQLKRFYSDGIRKLGTVETNIFASKAITQKNKMCLTTETRLL
jgi:hypothetical protein